MNSNIRSGTNVGAGFMNSEMNSGVNPGSNPGSTEGSKDGAGYGTEYVTGTGMRYGMRYGTEHETGYGTKNSSGSDMKNGTWYRTGYETNYEPNYEPNYETNHKTNHKTNYETEYGRKVKTKNGTKPAYDVRGIRTLAGGRGWTAWAGWLLCAAAAWYWALEKGGQAAWFVASVTGFIVLYAVLVGLTAFTRPSVTRSVSQAQIHSGEVVRVSVQVERTASWFPFVWMHIRDVLLGADGRPASIHHQLVFAGLKSRIHYEYEIADLPRGNYTFAPIAVAMKEPLGIAGKRRLSGSTAERRLTVYPQPMRLDAANVKRSGEQGDAAAALATMSAESSLVSTVRDYAHGDPLQRIHWKSTARTGGLKTKEMDALYIRRVTVVLDDAADAYGGGRMGRARFETAASAACAVIYDAKRQGLAADLRCGAQAGSAAEEEAPAQAARRALTRLAAAEPRGDLGLAHVLREQAARLAADRPLVLITPRLDAALADCIGMLRARRIPVMLIYISDRISGRVSEQISDKASNRTSDRIGDRADDRISDSVSGRNNNRVSRQIGDKVNDQIGDMSEPTQQTLAFRQLEILRCQVSVVSVSDYLTGRAAQAQPVVTGGVGDVGA